MISSDMYLATCIMISPQFNNVHIFFCVLGGKKQQKLIDAGDQVCVFTSNSVDTNKRLLTLSHLSSQTDSFHSTILIPLRGKNSKKNKVLLHYSPENNIFESFTKTKYRILLAIFSTFYNQNYQSCEKLCKSFQDGNEKGIRFKSPNVRVRS